MCIKVSLDEVELHETKKIQQIERKKTTQLSSKYQQNTVIINQIDSITKTPKSYFSWWQAALVPRRLRTPKDRQTATAQRSRWTCRCSSWSPWCLQTLSENGFNLLLKLKVNFKNIYIPTHPTTKKRVDFILF